MKVFSRISIVRDHFFAGTLVAIPFAVIAWIMGSALRMLWGIHTILPDGWQPESYIDSSALISLIHFFFTLVSIFILALAISFLGWISKQILGRKILEFVSEAIIQRIPLIRSVYGALDQLLRTMASNGGKQFSRVVYVEYPRAGCWTLAFVTGSIQDQIFTEPSLKLYVPTTPNPTSGFYLIVAEAQVRESHMTVEEAFKTILSLGVVEGKSHGRRG